MKIKDLVKSSFWATICYYTLSDIVARFKFFLGNIATDSGTIHSSMTLDESIHYLEQVFEDYKTYSGVSTFTGCVAEVGPGDNCGVALLFLQNGCQKVDLIDRFYSERNISSQAGIYQELLLKYPGLSMFIGGANLNNDNTFSSLERHYGADASAEKFFLNHFGYDFIVSRAVFEHLYDPLSALRSMTLSLNSGGYLLHKIDLRDHGLFSERNHELKFLEVPSFIYRWMTGGSGRPNRVLIHQYRTLMQDLGLDGKLLVTRLAGVGDIEPHLPYNEISSDLRAKSTAYVRSVRGQFADIFSSVSDDDLAVAGIFLVARKACATVSIE